MLLYKGKHDYFAYLQTAIRFVFSRWIHSQNGFLPSRLLFFCYDRGSQEQTPGENTKGRMRLEKGGKTSYRVFGYVRVSTKDQNEARQLVAMRQQGVPGRNIYVDKQSGKDFLRPQYAKLVAAVRPGDLVIVKSIDRLGRNYTEILEQWRILTREKHADIVVLDMPLLDTRAGKDLIGTLISDIVLQLLSYVAQTEREFIHQRQKEGIAAARARGVHFGAKPRKRPASFPEVAGAWARGEISAREAARRLKVSHTTFLRWSRETNPTVEKREE